MSVYPDSIQPLKNTGKSIGYDREVMQDVHGRVYYEIRGVPKTQMFLVRLLKGVIPVSYVVYDRKSGKYYSYEVPVTEMELQNAHAKETASYILEYVFRDGDHDSHNYVSVGNMRHVFYDFEFVIDFWYPCTENVQKAFLDMGKDKRDALTRRLVVLKRHVSGEDGENFIGNILSSVSKIPGDMPEIFKERTVGGVKMHPTVEMFQSEVLRRIDAMLDALAYANKNNTKSNT